MKSDNDKFLFIYATATKQKVGGVGLIISNKHLPSYRTLVKISDRIINVYFAGNPLVTIIEAYLPTETAAPNNKEEFYNNLLKAIESALPHNIMIVLSDFNARIGDDSDKTNLQIIGRNNYEKQMITANR